MRQRGVAGSAGSGLQREVAGGRSEADGKEVMDEMDKDREIGLMKVMERVKGKWEELYLGNGKRSWRDIASLGALRRLPH